MNLTGRSKADIEKEIRSNERELRRMAKHALSDYEEFRRTELVLHLSRLERELANLELMIDHPACEYCFGTGSATNFLGGLDCPECEGVGVILNKKKEKWPMAS